MDFATSSADDGVSTLVKAQGNELRISVNSPEGQSITDYLVDSTQGTISQAPGMTVVRGGEGWQEAYDAVMASLALVQSGLAQSGNELDSESMSSTISFMQSLA